MSWPHLIFFGLFIAINGAFGLFLVWRSFAEHVLQRFWAKRRTLFEAGEAHSAAQAIE